MPEEARGLAALDAAPEFPVRGEQQAGRAGKEVFSSSTRTVADQVSAFEILQSRNDEIWRRFLRNEPRLSARTKPCALRSQAHPLRSKRLPTALALKLERTSAYTPTIFSTVSA